MVALKAGWKGTGFPEFAQAVQGTSTVECLEPEPRLISVWCHYFWHHKLCVLRKHVGCIVQWCMPLFMQEHQQDVYNSIHTGNTQYFVPIHIYIEHTRIGPVCVSIHASHAQGVLYT